MRNGVPSGTPFCLKGLIRACGCSGRPFPEPARRWERQPGGDARNGRGRRSGGVRAVGEHAPGRLHLGWRLPDRVDTMSPDGSREPYIDIRPQGPMCYPGAGEAMTGSRRSACDGAASHEEPRDWAACPVGGRGAGARRHLRKPRRVCESAVGVRAHAFTGPLGSLRIPARMGGVTRA